MNASAKIAEREALRICIEHLTVLFPTEVSSFDSQVECTDGTVQYKLNAQSLRLFGLHRDVNDAHRAGANRLQNKKTNNKKTTAHSNMVAEQVATYGLVETFVTVSVITAPSCAWTVAALGRDESSRVDLVTRDLDVYRINAVVESSRQDLELVEVRKSLEFAEIRRRLQDAEVERVKLRQSAPKSPPEPLVLRSGESAT